MKKPTKAVLLSALIFPGLGHIFLKRYFSGFLLISAALACSYFLLSRIITRAMNIVNEIQSGSMAADLTSIIEMVSKQPADAAAMKIVTIGLAICWLMGVGGAYLAGRKMEADLAK